VIIAAIIMKEEKTRRMGGEKIEVEIEIKGEKKG
jgi:hypothetical protein